MTTKQFQQLKPGDTIWYVGRSSNGWQAFKREVASKDTKTKEVIFDDGFGWDGLLKGWPYKFCHLTWGKAQAFLERCRQSEDEGGL